MLLWIILIGAVGALAIAYKAVSGPSTAKSLKRRMEIVRERHSDSPGGAAQAQIRKMLGERTSRIEGYASTLIPKPALLRKRLDMTGKEITLGKYAVICLGITLSLAIVASFRGAPVLLALFFSLFLGVGGPHFVVGRMIK